jgi:C4-dicarboxylate transporter DctM subunit
MDTSMVLIIAAGVFAVMMLCEVPIALALAATGGIGIILLRSFEQATSAVGNVLFSSIHNYSLAIVPLYVLMGMFALHGHLSNRLFTIAAVALRWLPGALGVATVATCAGFAAVSGSSVATAASIGRMAVAQMRRAGYSAHLATGIVAAGGTLGILIPPSIAIVLYGVVTGESVAMLLLGGVVPGILLALAFAAFVVVYSVLVNRSSANAEAVRAVAAVPASSRDLALALDDLSPGAAAAGREAAVAVDDDDENPTATQLMRSVVWISLIIGVVIIGVFTGIVTVIESAAIASLVAVVMLASENMRTGVAGVWHRIRTAVLEAAATTAMALGLFAGASVLTLFLVMARVPNDFANWILGMDLPPMMVVVAILLAMIPLGMFLDAFSLIIIVGPLVHPVVVEMGYNGVWFGILFVIMLEIALITPPVGINSYVVAAATNTPVTSVFRGIAPFVGVAMAFIAILLAFPDLVTFFPGFVNE